MKIKHPDFSLAEGLNIQKNQLSEWETILRPEAFAELLKEAEKQNLLLHDNADGNDVWRGIDIRDWVDSDLTLRFKKGNNENN